MKSAPSPMQRFVSNSLSITRLRYLFLLSSFLYYWGPISMIFSELRWWQLRFRFSKFQLSSSFKCLGLIPGPSHLWHRCHRTGFSGKQTLRWSSVYQSTGGALASAPVEGSASFPGSAMTKYHKLIFLKQQKVTLSQFWKEKCEIKVLTGLCCFPRH